MSHDAGRCCLCAGELRHGVTTLDVRKDGELVVLQDIPAEVCSRCGEAYIAPEVSLRLDRFFAERRRRCEPERRLVVPLYAASQVMGA